MSTLAPPVAEPSHAVLEQAAEWYACLRDGRASAAERAAWQAWLQASAEHAAAWRYVEDIRRSFEPVRSVPDPRRTAGQLCEANERLAARRRVLNGVAALAGAGLFGWLAWRQTGWAGDLAAWTADQRTGVGEQRDLTLADGTRLWLNTASALDVRFNAQERRLVLLAGELFIETAHDTARPFLVDTPHGRMRALGTRFNVRLGEETTRLSVYEGAVEVRTAAGGAPSVVAAGKRVEFAEGALGAPTAADIAGEAWTEGTLVAERITLRELVQELRRYRKGHLGVADEVADLSVYGNFPVRDTDRVLRMLASTLPIRIEQPWSWWTRIEARR